MFELAILDSQPFVVSQIKHWFLHKSSHTHSGFQRMSTDPGSPATSQTPRTMRKIQVFLCKFVARINNLKKQCGAGGRAGVQAGEESC